MSTARAELGRIRDSIDNIDAAVVHLLAERFTHTRRVGELKARHGLPPADPGREARQIARLRSIAESARLDPEFAEKFLNFVVAEVIRHHESIARHAAEHRIPAVREESVPEPVLAEY
ncbi:chorismate mutase [Streptomyces showdoensis]|uniref:Chorismate mutase n=1 Tax=Streptomyces showdoensis TaxID=68268 RepID=A0A2P2GKW2_STREW|nr:chorismate mutase [Streptomyces showdoensis]KKZ72152.1 chorismate mutase [Streptomyces showdoensis]